MFYRKFKIPYFHIIIKKINKIGKETLKMIDNSIDWFKANIKAERNITGILLGLH